jgi:hypothetical protein
MNCYYNQVLIPTLYTYAHTPSDDGNAGSTRPFVNFTCASYPLRFMNMCFDHFIFVAVLV